MKADAVICPQAVRLAGSGGCAVYQLRNETGEGTITMYDVFPSVTLAWSPAPSPISRLGRQCWRS
mgnify:CR=1 FL=1